MTRDGTGEVCPGRARWPETVVFGGRGGEERGLREGRRARRWGRRGLGFARGVLDVSYPWSALPAALDCLPKKQRLRWRRVRLLPSRARTEVGLWRVGHWRDLRRVSA